MQLTRSQVKAWLDTMSDDTSRPVLNAAYIDQYDNRTVLVTTDGYVLTAMDAPGLKDSVGKFITRLDLVKWYKLANSKSLFTDEEALTLVSDVVEGKYPEWQKLIPTEMGALPSVTINAKYMLSMQTINNAPLKWDFGTDKFKPVIARANDNLYVIMPLKS